MCLTLCLRLTPFSVWFILCSCHHERRRHTVLRLLRSATPPVHNTCITALLRSLYVVVTWTPVSRTGLPQVRTNPFIAHLPSILYPFTYRILGFASSCLLAHGYGLTKVHFRLSGNFDLSFLQIPHWPNRHHVSPVGGPRQVSSDTLAFVYIFPPIGVMVGHSPTRFCSCWAHTSLA